MSGSATDGNQKISQLSPYMIKFMIHCHVDADEWESVGSNVYTQTVEVFLEAGLIEKNLDKTNFPKSYIATARGKAFVTAICRTPFPQIAFVDKRNGEILEYA